STISRVGPVRVTKPTARARLRVVYPPELEGEAELGAEPIIVGRELGSEAGFEVEHGTVSRRHLAVTWDAARALHLASDLDSRNGSAIDGVSLPAEPRPLQDQSVVRLGDVLLIYECGAGLSVADPPEVSKQAVPGRAAAMRLERATLARAAPD